jgi:hypothetical protein
MAKVIGINGTWWCDEPDRDEPRIKCGYPIPCPYHTAMIDEDDPNFVEKVTHLARMKGVSK